MQKLFVDYSAFGCLLDSLCKKIENGKTKFNCIYAPPRGGWPVAVHISHYFELPILENLDFVKEIEDEKIKILLVDDIIDTGKTMIQVTDFIKDHVSYVICSLFFKPHSKIIVDICGEIVKNDQWVIFPWELKQIPSSDPSFQRWCETVNMSNSVPNWDWNDEEENRAWKDL
ncbi:MAG: phosphoribosyltransferase [Melioribacteraceae bacterium]|nr:phosphoribosyltransferase [Melioribacteraceae bacterium]